MNENQIETLARMADAHNYMNYIQTSVLCTSYLVSAMKIIRSQPFKQIEKQVIFIWLLAVSQLFFNMTTRCYTRKSEKNNNNIFWVEISLSCLMAIFLNITIWEFSWQLFNVSVEVEERLSKNKHKLNKRTRKTVNIVVVVMIITSFIFSAYW